MTLARDEVTKLLEAAERGQCYASAETLAALCHDWLERESVTWRAPTEAPRDGTILRLRIQPDRDSHTSFEDSGSPYETIGFNNLSNTGEDRWQFAGWDWQHDCIVKGHGVVIGWMPFYGSPASEESTAVLRSLVAKARKLVEAVTFDDSGFQGQGGNGGLLSRETIRAADELRLSLDAVEEPKP